MLGKNSCHNMKSEILDNWKLVLPIKATKKYTNEFLNYINQQHNVITLVAIFNNTITGQTT